MRLIFAGTPEFAASALAALLAAGHQVPLVLTQPDRPAGRGMQLLPSAVKKLALEHQLALYQPERLKDPATHTPIRQVVAEQNIDLMIVAAYGLILPQAVLDLPRLGCLNIHASLLPRWRGAAPIQRAIEAGDQETGITIMQMDAGLDTGAMLLKESLTITDKDNAATLHDKLAIQGANLIVTALAQLEKLSATPQAAEGVTYAAKILKTEAALDWQCPAIELERKIRAFNPFPAASCSVNATPLKIWRAELAQAHSDTGKEAGSILAIDASGITVACGTGALRLLELQKPGGKRLAARDFLAGFPLSVGTRLSH